MFAFLCNFPVCRIIPKVLLHITQAFLFRCDCVFSEFYLMNAAAAAAHPGPASLKKNQKKNTRLITQFNHMFETHVRPTPIRGVMSANLHCFAAFRAAD